MPRSLAFDILEESVPWQLLAWHPRRLTAHEAFDARPGLAAFIGDGDKLHEFLEPHSRPFSIGGNGSLLGIGEALFELEHGVPVLKK